MTTNDNTICLFSPPKGADSLKTQPLAARMRPCTLDEFTGQKHIIGPGQLLRRPIEADRIQPLIFYGPPGTGKTSLAQVIAGQTKSKFERLSGVESNVADIRRLLAAAKNRLDNRGTSTIVFVDEIHGFNKSQRPKLGKLREEIDALKLGRLPLLTRLPAGLEFWHFGDSDDAGFDILRVLQEKSGREFQPLHMQRGKIPFEQESMRRPKLKHWPFH
jgi:DNA polymerase III delta prime subunit